MNSLRPPRFEGSVVLGRGRRLGFAEYGPSSGRPLIWFHGTPGARRQIAPEAREAAYERNVRLIAIERPGIGASTPHCYDEVHDFALDIERFIDNLEIERFAVAGLSGGGPYALACAHHMPNRVVSTAILGGVAPSVGEDKAEGGVTNFTLTVSPILSYVYRPLGGLLRTLILGLEPLGHQAIDLFARFMPPGDKLVFEDERVRHMFIDDLVNGSEDHMQAACFDGILFGRDWGFRLGKVRGPVHMWYGDADNIVPVEHGVHMSERIPDAELRVRPGEGHLGGLGATHEIFDAVLADWDADRASTPAELPEEHRA